MKKILIVNHTKKSGGAFISLLDIVDMLKDVYEVTVGIPHHSSEVKKQLEYKKIKHIEFETTIPVLPYFSGSGPLFSFTMLKNLWTLRFRKRFSKEILSTKYDLIILNSSCMFLSIIKHVNEVTPVVLIVRETIKNNILKLVYKKVMNCNFSAVTFISNYDRKNLGLKIPTTVVPDIYRLNVHENFEKQTSLMNNDKVNVLYLGGSSVIKGGLVLLKAISYLNSNIYVTVAGNIDEKVRLTFPTISYFRRLRFIRYFRLYKNHTNVTFLGFSDDIHELMKESDFVVFPSIMQHQPRPGIEAGVYRKPIILTNFDCTKEYFIDGYNAITFKKNNHKDLALKINMLAKDSTLRNKLGQNNALMSKKYHDYEKAKLILLDLINTILG